MMSQTVLRAWIRQLDEELNKEYMAAQSNNAASTEQVYQRPAHS